MDVKVYVALIALGGALITAFLGFVAAHLTKRARDQELFQSALEFLTGQTQKRSVGIALLRSYGDTHRDKRGVIREIFRAQALHLLDEGYGVADHKRRRIERYNLLLLKEVLADWGDQTPDKAANDYSSEEFKNPNPQPAAKEPERK